MERPGQEGREKCPTRYGADDDDDGADEEADEADDDGADDDGAVVVVVGTAGFSMLVFTLL